MHVSTAQPRTTPSSRDHRDAHDVNAVVAYNLRAIRKLRGLTQEQVAERLAAFTGHRLPQASISAMERSFDTERRRLFDAHTLYLLSKVFDVPIVYFFLPPPTWLHHKPRRHQRAERLLAQSLTRRASITAGHRQAARRDHALPHRRRRDEPDGPRRRRLRGALAQRPQANVRARLQCPAPGDRRSPPDARRPARRHLR